MVKLFGSAALVLMLVCYPVWAFAVPWTVNHPLTNDTIKTYDRWGTGNAPRGTAVIYRVIAPDGGVNQEVSATTPGAPVGDPGGWYLQLPAKLFVHGGSPQRAEIVDVASNLAKAQSTNVTVEN